MIQRVTLAALVAGILAVALMTASAIADLFWHARGDIVLDKPVTPVRIGTVAAPVDLTPVRALAPFGTVRQADKMTIAAAGADLGLVLRGIVLSNPEIRSRATLSQGDGPAQSYMAGDTIRQDVVLDSVAIDHVMIRAGGRLLRLGFPDATDGAMDASAAIRAGQAAAANDVPDTAKDDTQAVIDFYRRQVASNPALVLEGLGVRPGDGGYVIRQQAASPVLRAGLQPGDVIVSVNGQAVGNVQTDQARFEEVIASGRARVEVRRGDRIIVLSYPLR